MKTDSITITRPDDFHLHIRNFPDAEKYLADSAQWFSRVLLMPNTVPPIDSPERLIAYREEVEQSGIEVTPLMTFKIMPTMTRSDIKALAKAGAVAGKLYPRGATTNSDDGVQSIEEMYPVFQAMEKEGIILSLHGEDPSVSVFDREKAFLPVVDKIVRAFPGLKVILEHLSTIEGVAYVLSAPERVAATLTAHHLWYTVDDLMGRGFMSHLFCKPVIQTSEDRGVLRAAAVSGNPKFFFGSDSAPHPKERKETFSSAAGIYSARVALPAVTQVFDEYGKLDKLEDFVSGFGAKFYGLKRNKEQITLVRNSWRVPDEVHGVVQMLAGGELNWELKK